jgi:hypothetical protein
MDSAAYIAQVAAICTARGLPNAEQEATEFVRDNPEIETQLSAETCAEELIAGFADAADAITHHPARYGAS